MSPLLEVFVPGEPKGQGSMRPIPAGNGRIYMKPSGGDAFTKWRNSVIDRAMDAMHADGADGLFWPVTEPVACEIVFGFERPKGHYGTGRNAGTVRSSAPEYPTVKNDIDKLCRAVLDALTAAAAIRDDGQVVILHAEKTFARPGAHILLTAVPRPPLIPVQAGYGADDVLPLEASHG